MFTSLRFTQEPVTAPKGMPLDTVLFLHLSDSPHPVRISEIPFVNDNRMSRVPGQFASSTVRSTLNRMIAAGLVKRFCMYHRDTPVHTYTTAF